MTHPADAVANQTCTLPGCYEPRHVSKSGRVYQRCDEHFRADYQNAANSRKRPPPVARPQRHPSAVGKHVAVLVVDYATERVYRVEGVVCEEETFPKTHGTLLKLLAEAGRDGVYVAKSQPYREEDLYEHVEEIKT